MGNIKNTFDLQNPWRFPGYKFPEEASISRNIYDSLLQDLSAKEVTILVGARQVGKTFLIKKLVEELISKKGIDPKQVFYFNLDAFNLIDLVSQDREFIDFISYYGLSGKTSFVIFDEAQRIPEVGLLIKQYYDLGLDLKFIVSGSFFLQIKSQVKETLSGRKRLHELYPVSFGEFLHFKGLGGARDLSMVMKFEASQYQKLLKEFILFGGYPGVVKADSRENKELLLKELYRSYVEKDISNFLKIEDIAGFNRLVQFLAAQSGGLLKINEVSKNIRVSRHFVEKYLHALNETYVTACLRPYFVNLGKAIIKTPKLYFLDTGIRNAVFNTFDAFDRGAEAGLMVENFVFSELIKTVDPKQLWFYRTSTGSEIDFLYVQKNRVVPVEVKYRITRQKVVPKIFNTFAKGAGVNKVVVITKDYLYDEERENFRVIFRPAWSVCDLWMELGTGTK